MNLYIFVAAYLMYNISKTNISVGKPIRVQTMSKGRGDLVQFLNISHVSCVTCHVSCVTCHISHFFCVKQSGETGPNSVSVCYQRGIPSQAFFNIKNINK